MKLGMRDRRSYRENPRGNLFVAGFASAGLAPTTKPVVRCYNPLSALLIEHWRTRERQQRVTTEIRIPLENGTELPFSRLTPVTIEGEPIGYGGSCIAYRAYRFEGNIKRYCIVKECYPKKLASANMLERKGKNLKSKKESVTEFKTQKTSSSKATQKA